MGDTMILGAVESAMRQAAVGAVYAAMAAVVLLTVAWALAAGFRPRNH
jgi:hypothetical protein